MNLQNKSTVSALDNQIEGTVAPKGQGASSSSIHHRRLANPAVVHRQPGSTRIVYTIPAKLPFWHQTWFLITLFVMGISFLGIAALLLLLDLPLDQYSASPVAAASQQAEITYGTVLKLMHDRTKFRLHSHEVPYGSGSGQQSVTGFPNVDDSNSYWIVRPIPDSSDKQGDLITSGTIIRLQHMKTRKWLHSHLHLSPISGNLEVSCFGGDDQSDTGDYWRLEIEGKGKVWTQDQKIRLQHIDTGGYLHSHDKKYTRIVNGQQEVCAMTRKNPENIWLAAEGVYLPISKKK